MSAGISELDTGWFSPKTVACLLGLSKSVVYAALRGPYLTGYRRGSREIIIRHEDLLAWVAYRQAVSQ